MEQLSQLLSQEALLPYAQSHPQHQVLYGANNQILEQRESGDINVAKYNIFCLVPFWSNMVSKHYIVKLF